MAKIDFLVKDKGFFKVKDFLKVLNDKHNVSFEKQNSLFFFIENHKGSWTIAFDKTPTLSDLYSVAFAFEECKAVYEDYVNLVVFNPLSRHQMDFEKDTFINPLRLAIKYLESQNK